MKRIAIFCDGTWNRPDAENLTNVARLANAVMRDLTSPKPMVQQVIYVPGVGAGRGSNRLARGLDRIGGGAFGWGLDATLLEAYRHLAFNYTVGDEIYIFGFSRGGFTARSLAGMLRSCGIPDAENFQRIPEALEVYRKRGRNTHPDGEAGLEFRRGFSRFVATSADEQTDRKRHQMYAALLEIRYLGIWDTVGSLGVPNQFFIADFFNERYKFHDLVLSRSVRAARHAVAVDERRRNFQPTLWENWEDLNVQIAPEPARYFQEFFPGTHGGVGGGGPITGLSSEALRWIAQGAQDAGLVFNEALLKRETDQIEVVNTPLDNYPWYQKGTLSGLLALSQADRPPPRHDDELSDAARLRMRENAAYRPATLQAYWPD